MSLPVSLIPPKYPSEFEPPALETVPESAPLVPTPTPPKPKTEKDNGEELIVCTMDEDKSENDQDLTNFTLKELREMCKTRGLNPNGKKAELINRLQ